MQVVELLYSRYTPYISNKTHIHIVLVRYDILPVHCRKRRADFDIWKRKCCTHCSIYIARRETLANIPREERLGIYGHGLVGRLFILSCRPSKSVNYFLIFPCLVFTSLASLPNITLLNANKIDELENGLSIMSTLPPWWINIMRTLSLAKKSLVSFKFLKHL